MRNEKCVFCKKKKAKKCYDWNFCSWECEIAYVSQNQPKVKK